MSACDAGDGDGTGSGSGEAGGEGGEGGEGGAPAADQAECKEACNKLKFFDCNDAADHAACFLACESAPASGIELFVACVENDTCDPECAVDLEGQAGGEGGGGEEEGGGGGEEGGTPTSSCPDACNEYVAAGCVPPVDCAGFCSSLSGFEQEFVGYCVDRRDGCTLPAECEDALEGGEGGVSEEGGVGEGVGEVGGDDPIMACQGACDDMQFFDCIDEAQHASCRELCTTAATDDIDTFVSCSFGCQDDACWTVFEGA